MTFAGETASGWQQASFSTPVAITANTTYVVSYQAPNGFYSANGGYFSSAADNAPLHGLADGRRTQRRLQLRRHRLPHQRYNNTNYWVNVIFARTPSRTGCFVGVSGEWGDGCGGVGEAGCDVNQPVTASSVVFTVKDSSGTAVAGTVAYDSASSTATFTPGSALAYGTTYTATVSGATNHGAGDGGAVFVAVHHGRGCDRVPVQRVQCNFGAVHCHGQRRQCRGTGHEVPL